MAYSDIQTRIASDMARDDQSANIKNAINDAIKFWEGESFIFNEKRFQLQTLQGEEYYSLSGVPLPSNVFPNMGVILQNIDGSALGTGEQVLQIETMTCKPLATGLPYPVTSRTMAWFDKNQANPLVAQGLPEFYAYFDGGMRIYPVPNNFHTLTLSALYRLPPFPLVNSTDNNAWLTEAEGLIRETAKMFIYRDVLRDDQGVANCQLAIYGGDGPNGMPMPGHLSSLKRKATALITEGRVEAWKL